MWTLSEKLAVTLYVLLLFQIIRKRPIKALKDKQCYPWQPRNLAHTARVTGATHFPLIPDPGDQQQTARETGCYSLNSNTVGYFQKKNSRGMYSCPMTHLLKSAFWLSWTPFTSTINKSPLRLLRHFSNMSNVFWDPISCVCVWGGRSFTVTSYRNETDNNISPHQVLENISIETHSFHPDLPDHLTKCVKLFVALDRKMKDRARLLPVLCLPRCQNIQ